MKTTYNTHVKVKIFSDNIFLCASLEQENFIQGLNDFFNVVNEIESTMINMNHSFVRGAVVIGNVHFEENFVLGEALLKAYEIESKIAIFPRIVIDETVFEYFQKGFPFFKKDFDGVYFYDFIRYAGHILTDHKTGRKEGTYLNLRQFKANILENYKNNKNNIAVIQKMNWLRNYLNDYCQEKKFDYSISDTEVEESMK